MVDMLDADGGREDCWEGSKVDTVGGVGCGWGWGDIVDGGVGEGFSGPPGRPTTHTLRSRLRTESLPLHAKFILIL